MEAPRPTLQMEKLVLPAITKTRQGPPPPPSWWTGQCSWSTSQVLSFISTLSILFQMRHRLSWFPAMYAVCSQCLHRDSVYGKPGHICPGPRFPKALFPYVVREVHRMIIVQFSDRFLKASLVTNFMKTQCFRETVWKLYDVRWT